MKKFNKNIEKKRLSINQNKNTYITRLSISLSCLILLCAVILFAFAKFETSSEVYTLINGKMVSSSGDVNIISYIYDGSNHSTPPDRGKYILKSADCSNSDVTYDSRTWDLTIKNYTAKVNCNLTFEKAVDVQVTIYSAPDDEVYYYDGNEKVIVGTTNSAGVATVNLPQSVSLTLYSSVAKEPSNLSNDYSKQILLTDDAEDVVLMPTDLEHIAYWYGYEGNYWEYGTTITKYTNYMSCHENAGGILYFHNNTPFSEPIDKIKVIVKNINLPTYTIYPWATFNDTGSYATPSWANSTFSEAEYDVIQYLERKSGTNFGTGVYGNFGVGSLRKLELYALWYE